MNLGDVDIRSLFQVDNFKDKLLKCISNNTKKNIREQFKDDFKKLKIKQANGIDLVKDYCQECSRKIDHRKWLKKKVATTTIEERLLARRIKQVQDRIFYAVGYPSNYEKPNISYGELNLSISQWKFWEEYTKRQSYSHNMFQIEGTIPRKKLAVLDICDGIVNMYFHSIKQVGDFKIYKATWIKKSRGYSFEFVDGFIARNNNVYYHSTKSVKHAIKGLQNKIKKLNEEQKEIVVNQDTLITRNLYKKLTGACHVGIANFCVKHNLQDVSKMRLGDLLPLLEGEYGYHAIKKLLS